jgi:L-alanine-DL-glutamate epimerase-like enolase superfamily enzyme
VADAGNPLLWGRRDRDGVRRALALRRYWLEEPLPTSDVDGYAVLRGRTSLRVAAGEMVRTLHEGRDLILRGGVDVVQPDVMLAGGIGGCRRIAAVADAAGHTFSPHTWTNGVGIIANLHLAMAAAGPFIEVPFDPQPGVRRRNGCCRGRFVAAGSTIRRPGPRSGRMPRSGRPCRTGSHGTI